MNALYTTHLRRGLISAMKSILHLTTFMTMLAKYGTRLNMLRMLVEVR